MLALEAAVGWLSALEAGRASPSSPEASSTRSSDVAADAGEIVTSYRLPDDIQGVTREALERQRAYGSEAMLGCGRIEWPRDGPARVAIAWLGDVSLRVFGRHGTAEDFSGRTADRWSSRRGPRGSVASRVWTAGEVERVIACSDGLLPELEAAVSLSDVELDERLRALTAQEVADDIVLVDIAVAAHAMPATRGRADHAREPRRQEPPPPESAVADVSLRPPTGFASEGFHVPRGAVVVADAGRRGLHRRTRRQRRFQRAAHLSHRRAGVAGAPGRDADVGARPRDRRAGDQPLERGA